MSPPISKTSAAPKLPQDLPPGGPFMFENNLQNVLIGWVAVIVFMAVARRRTHTAGVGLVLAYIINLWMIHWAASFLYLLPWYHGPQEAVTIAGTEQSLYAVAAFA